VHGVAIGTDAADPAKSRPRKHKETQKHAETCSQFHPRHSILPEAGPVAPATTSHRIDLKKIVSKSNYMQKIDQIASCCFLYLLPVRNKSEQISPFAREPAEKHLWAKQAQ
jgi:hypothetical protein